MTGELTNAIPRELHLGEKWLPSNDRVQHEIPNAATEPVISKIASGSAVDW